MGKITIDRSQLKKATSQSKLTESLMIDRLMVGLSFVAVMATVITLVYTTLDQERLEIVYLDAEKIDAPTLLPRVRDTQNALRTDRWIRGVVRRFINFYFLSPDDSSQFSERALGWLHAHTGKAGQKRSDVLLANFRSFEEKRRNTYSRFFPVNDPSAVRIRSSGRSAGVYHVEVPGTYVTKTEAGESYFDARLKLVIERTHISGIPNRYGQINATGLKIATGSIEFVEDITKEHEVTRWPLFPNDAR